MNLSSNPKRHRYPASIISTTVWRYHRFNHSYRDISEDLAFRGIIVSCETIRGWCIKFASSFSNVIKKCERNPTDKWHLDEMHLKINGEKFVLWRAVDSEGHELDVLLQKRKDKKSAIRFITKLLDSYPASRVVVSDKLPSYRKPIKHMMPNTKHRTHKGLNNRVEMPTRPREEKKSAWSNLNHHKAFKGLYH